MLSQISSDKTAWITINQSIVHPDLVKPAHYLFSLLTMADYEDPANIIAHFIAGISCSRNPHKILTIQFTMLGNCQNMGIFFSTPCNSRFPSVIIGNFAWRCNRKCHNGILIDETIISTVYSLSLFDGHFRYY